jgi:dihydroneopterin aldolase
VTTTDTIRVEGIAFQARVGFEQSERMQPQRIEVDVALDLPLGAGAASDELRETLDYRGVCQAVVTAGTAHPYHLIEAMAGAIADALAALAPRAGLAVTVWKVRPLLVGEPQRVSVTLRRGPAATAV